VLQRPVAYDALVDAIQEVLDHRSPIVTESMRRRRHVRVAMCVSESLRAGPEATSAEWEERRLHGGVSLKEATAVRAYHMWEAAGRP